MKIIQCLRFKAKLVFLNGYQGYASFLKFLKIGDKNLLLYYESSDISYCQIEVKSMTREELEAGTIQSEIVFQKKSLWLKKPDFFY